MPVSYKQRSRRNRRRRSTPWYRKKFDALDIARTAAKGVWYLKGLVNSEMKTHTYSAQSSIDYNGTLTALTAIAQGDTAITRDGNSIFMRYINMRGCIDIASVTSTLSMRIMLVQDTSTNPASRVTSDVLDSSVMGTVYAPYASMNKNESGRFKVLYSKLFTVGPYNQAQAITISKKIRLHAKYDGALSTDHKVGNIYLVMVSNTVTTNPTFTYSCRIGYHDN